MTSETTTISKIEIDNILRTWTGLNTYLMTCDEVACKVLLKAELGSKRRRIIALRIHSRLNLMRAQKERNDISVKTGH